MARRKAQATVSEQLREAIQQSDLSIYAMGKASGVSHQQIGRFAKGERGLTLEVFAKLATALGLQLAPVADPAHVAVAVAVAAIQDDEVLAAVRSNTSRNAPAKLADVYRSLQASIPALTLGQFHDAIRGLRTAGKITLEPFTGAAYSLKGGEACLILGTEIMAFVTAR